MVNKPSKKLLRKLPARVVVRAIDQAFYDDRSIWICRQSNFILEQIRQDCSEQYFPLLTAPMSIQ